MIVASAKATGRGSNRRVADLERDAERHDAEHERRSEARKVADLAGAEAVAPSVGMTLRIGIGDRGDAERARMGRHVKAVGEQRHRVEDETGGDFRHHHHGGEGDHPQRAARILVVPFAKENMAVRQCLDFAVERHDRSLFRVTADRRQRTRRRPARARRPDRAGATICSRI